MNTSRIQMKYRMVATGGDKLECVTKIKNKY